MPDRAVSMVARGTTFYHGGTASSTGGTGLVGTVSVLPDTDPADSKKRRTQGDVTAILVRNVSGVTLLPKSLVKWKAGKEFFEVDGYCSVTDERCAGVVDDHLPAAGVADDDIFWLIVKGPCLVISSKSNMSAAPVVGDPVYAQTAAASTFSTTAGRFDRNAQGAEDSRQHRYGYADRSQPSTVNHPRLTDTVAAVGKPSSGYFRRSVS
jgi:hypothetical protein